MPSTPPALDDGGHRRSSVHSTASIASNWSQSPADWQAHILKAVPRSVSASASASASGPCPQASPSPSSSSSPSVTPSILLRLPPELVIHHLLPHLEYPSLLSLRLSHPYFYHSPLLYPARAPAINLRVAWLKDRGVDGNMLVPTKSGSLNVASDEGFLANKQVQELLRRERRHGNCQRGEAGCRVVLGMMCGGPRRVRLSWMRRVRRCMEGWDWSGGVCWVLSITVAVSAMVVYIFGGAIGR